MKTPKFRAFHKEFGKHFNKKRTGSGYMYLNCAIKTEESSYTLREYKGVNRKWVKKAKLNQ